jgi:hypothetical protein
MTMQITLTLVAESGEALRQQLLDMLAALPAPPAVRQNMEDLDPPVPLEMEPKTSTYKSSPKIPAKKASPKNGQGSGAPAQKDQSVVEKSQGSEGSGAVIPEIDRGTTLDDAGTPVPPVSDTPEVLTKDALAMKERVIDALQAAWVAGKVQKVREVLSKYGSGAKSFRELDISSFPAIEKALNAGALN